MSIPYIRFETRQIEDRQATIESGRIRYKDIDFVIITPPGRKDEVEKVATEWLDDIEQKARQKDRSAYSADNKYDLEIVTRFKTMYNMFKEEKEIPPEGIAIKTVDWLTPAEKSNILGANIRTVEDLATATEEGLQNIGFGSRDLKKRAQNSLESMKGGKAALQIEALEKRVQDQEEFIKTLMEQIQTGEVKPKKKRAA